MYIFIKMQRENSYSQSQKNVHRKHANKITFRTKSIAQYMLVYNRTVHIRSEYISSYSFCIQRYLKCGRIGEGKFENNSNNNNNRIICAIEAVSVYFTSLFRSRNDFNQKWKVSGGGIAGQFSWLVLIWRWRHYFCTQFPSVFFHPKKSFYIFILYLKLTQFFR